MRDRKLAPIAAALAGAVLIGGCGLGSGVGTSAVQLNVTENFGATTLGELTQRHAPGSENVLGLLRRGFRVRVQSGGPVRSIDGRAARPGRGGWSFYVNGIAAAAGPGATTVGPGDQIWWDLHDGRANHSIPAVVGSFPEPFTSGSGGKRFPTVVDCAADVAAACSTVGRALGRAHVPYANQTIGGGSGSDSLTIVVGTWSDLHTTLAADLVAAGPAKSGVYAQFVGPAGQVLELDNPAGQVVRALRAGAGLVAVTEQSTLNEPTWLVTGTDVAGVRAAAAALTPAALHDHFAVAVSGGRELPLPLSPAR